MFKKIREKLYDRQMKKTLESVKFDTFMYYSDSVIPAFVTKQGKSEIYSVFFPKTEGSFKMAFEKLKNLYFKKVPHKTAKENIIAYCGYYNFSDEVVSYCMEIFNNKKSELYNFKGEKNNKNLSEDR